MDTASDLVIAGGGPVGLMLALALERAGLQAILAGDDDLPPDRPIALAHGTCLLLDRLGILGSVPATPIEMIHVSQQAGFGRALIEARDYALAQLGRVVSYSSLVSAMRARLQTARWCPRVVDWSEDADRVLVHFAGKPQPSCARLLALADGMPAREGKGHSYDQTAVVCQVRTEKPHANTAFERFTPQGPLALLPNGEGFALVWSTSPGEAQSLCAAETPEFLRRLAAAFGSRLGRFLEAGPRHSFPLSLRFAADPAGCRAIAIGNAAQTLHPVAGQGLNLGMRDAWELAELLAAAPREEIGSPAFVRAFAQRRALDRRGGIGLTDAIVRIFSTRDPLLSAVRGAGLAALDLMPPARRFLAHRMMYGARAFP